MSLAAVRSGNMGADTGGSRIAFEVKAFLADAREKLGELAALDMADNARESVLEAKKALADAVKNANEGFESSMDEAFMSKSYTKSSGEYRREAVVGSSLFGGLDTERQEVGTYRWYAMSALTLSVDLSESRLANLDSDQVIDLVGLAQAEVGKKQKTIFGDGKDKTDAEKRAAGLEWDVSANGEVKQINLGEGEFGRHIGWAPIFDDEPDPEDSRSDNIEVAGSGELGRMMTDLIWNQIKEGKGWSEMGSPAWDKPLWNDDGSWFKAPSIRGISSIAASVVSTIVSKIGPVGMAIGYAITVGNDAMFACLDAYTGQISWSEAGEQIGKSALSNAATTVLGAGFKGLGTLAGKVGGVGTLLKSGVAGARVIATTVASKAIQAGEFKDGRLQFDDQDFGDFMEETFESKDMWAGAASAALGSYVNAKMDGWLLGDGNGNKLAETIFNKSGIESFDSLLGSLAGEATSSMITGNANFNVLNFRDIAQVMGWDWYKSKDQYGNMQWMSNGLMEMHMGEDGFSMNFGTGGTDISGSAIAASMAGIRDAGKIANAKLMAFLGNMEGISTLNAVNGLGYMQDADARTLGGKIWSGEQKIRYGDITGGLGYSEGDTINIDSRLLGGGEEGAAQLASVLAHEGDHQNGYGEQSAYLSQIVGFSDLQTAWGVRGDNLISGIGAMADYYRENGEGATIEILERQGLFASDDGVQYSKYILDPKVDAWVYGRYGFDTANYNVIKESEIVRQMYRTGAPIWKEELQTFTEGEGTRLGVEADFREREIEKYADAKRTFDAIAATGYSVAADKKEALRKAGLDVDAMERNGTFGAFSEALTAVLTRVTIPAYMDFFMGEIAGKLMPAGFAGFTSSAISDYLKTGDFGSSEQGKAALAGAKEKAIDYALKQKFGDDKDIKNILNGFKPGQISTAIGVFEADISAAIGGYAYAHSVTALYGQYADAIATANTASKAMSYNDYFLMERSGKELAMYSMARDFIANGTEQFDDELMSYLNQKSSNQYWYKKYGYAGGLQGDYQNKRLGVILTMTQDTNINKYFTSSIKSYWYPDQLTKKNLLILHSSYNSANGKVYTWSF
jgi:hypothetical protein